MFFCYDFHNRKILKELMLDIPSFRKFYAFHEPFVSFRRLSHGKGRHMTTERPTTGSEGVYDELLVLRWQSGEAEAMDELVGRWHGRLFRHVRRMVDSVDEAADVMQETWLAMIRSVQWLDDPQRFPVWAYRVASNNAVDFVRKKSRRRTVPLEEPEKIVDVTKTESSDDFPELLKNLSVEHRAVVSLRYGEDMPLEIVSETLCIPLGTVKLRLHYALEFLRKTNEK